MKTRSYRSVLILLLACLATSCAYGPKRKHDTWVDVLNGHNYRSVVAAPYFYVREAPVYKVSGQVLHPSFPAPLPLRFQPVALRRGGRELLRANTDNDGKFILTGDFSDGDYTVEVVSERYFAARSVTVRSYSTENIVLTAKPRLELRTSFTRAASWPLPHPGATQHQ